MVEVPAVAQLLPFVVACPMVGFLVLLAFGRRLGKPAISVIACGTVFLSFVCAALSVGLGARYFL